ncbi:MAG: hypothetical protein H8D26_03175 [Methanomicrobia archaeon]|nr:hypothetical protein [Methanomicrobia archaeon]
MIGREKFLEKPRSVTMYFDGNILERLDQLAGQGNRSSYVRWLVENADGKDIEKHIKIEKENHELKKRITELERQVAASQVRDSRGPPLNVDEVDPVLERLQKNFMVWLANFEKYNKSPSVHMYHSWTQNVSKSNGIKQKTLMDYLENKKLVPDW